MKRRTFLIAAGVAAAGAAATAWRLAAGDSLASVLARTEGLIRSPASRLRRHYEWLAIEPAAIDAYVADYGRAFRLWRFSALSTDFYTRFLLSTNFFSTYRGPGVASPPVTYVRFYDPEDRRCHNPLAAGPAEPMRRERVG